MKCPHCTKEIHFKAEEVYAYENDPHDETDNSGFDITHGFCPSCNELIVLVREGTYDDGELNKIQMVDIVYPKNIAVQKLPIEVPNQYAKDFEEAATVLSVGPKASAAISRRLLQTILHEKFEIKARNLNKEIDEFISLKGLPSYISEAVDAVRNIGNFAAHPIKK